MGTAGIAEVKRTADILLDGGSDQFKVEEDDAL